MTYYYDTSTRSARWEELGCRALPRDTNSVQAHSLIVLHTGDLERLLQTMEEVSVGPVRTPDDLHRILGDGANGPLAFLYVTGGADIVAQFGRAVPSPSDNVHLYGREVPKDRPFSLSFCRAFRRLAAEWESGDCVKPRWECLTHNFQSELVDYAVGMALVSGNERSARQYLEDAQPNPFFDDGIHELGLVGDEAQTLERFREALSAQPLRQISPDDLGRVLDILRVAGRMDP